MSTQRVFMSEKMSIQQDFIYEKMSQAQGKQIIMNNRRKIKMMELGILFFGTFHAGDQ